MSDFFAAIGLVFAIEGLMFAAFPLGTKRAIARRRLPCPRATAHRRRRLGRDRRWHRLAGAGLNGF
jgi:hypothetical protein